MYLWLSLAEALNHKSATCHFTRYLPRYLLVFFFLSLHLLIGWQLSIWICCKPFFSLLYNCHLLCFWRLALSIVVKVFPRHFIIIIIIIVTIIIIIIICGVSKAVSYLIFRTLSVRRRNPGAPLSLNFSKHCFNILLCTFRNRLREG